MTAINDCNKIIERAQDYLCQEIAPQAAKFDKDGGVSRAVIDSFAQEGYLAAPFPKKYGGLGLDPVSYGRFTELLGKACCSLRSLVTVHTSLVGETLWRVGSDEQRKKWIPQLASGELLAAFALSEPTHGSDARGIETTWRQEGDHYILNGVKKWITFGGIADVFIVIASSNGKPTAFIVERSAGLSTALIGGLMAARGTYLAEVRLDNVKVPKKNVLGAINFGFEYIVSTALDYGRYSIAWAGVGLAQAALDAMTSYANSRVQFGEKIADFQLIRAMVADAVTKIHAARALSLRAGELRITKNHDAVIETTIAKYMASKVAVEVVNDAMQVHGANGFTDRYPVERLYREAKTLEIIEGSSQIQQEIIAKFGLSRYGKVRELI